MARTKREREVYVGVSRGVRVVDVGALERNLCRRIRGMIDRGELRETADFLEAERRLFGPIREPGNTPAKTAPSRRGKTPGKRGAPRPRRGR